MKPITQVRRERLMELVREAGSQVAVGLRIGKHKNHIHQWLLAPDEPGARNIGSKSARLLEVSFARPEGWMDSDAEAFSGVNEQSANYDYRHSRAARPSVPILAQALGIIAIDEEVNGPYPAPKQAELLLELCDRLAAGEDEMRLIAFVSRQHYQGEVDGDQEAGGSR